MLCSSSKRDDVILAITTNDPTLDTRRQARPAPGRESVARAEAGEGGGRGARRSHRRAGEGRGCAGGSLEVNVTGTDL